VEAMIVPRGEIIEMGKRMSINQLLEEMRNSAFTGYVEISYRADELSNAKIIFRNGEPVACGVEKIISKRELRGMEAFEELSLVKNCVADIYALDEEKVSKAISWNTNAVLKKMESTLEKKIGFVSNSVRDVREVLDIAPKKADLLSFDDSEETVVVDRQAVLQKYGIKEPSISEIEGLIASALETDGLLTVQDEDISTLREELKSIAERYLGRISNKVVNVIEEMNVDNIEEKLPEVEKNAKKLVMFIPREKIDLMLAEMKGVLGKYTEQ
jgi:hypothetical protein